MIAQQKQISDCKERFRELGKLPTKGLEHRLHFQTLCRQACSAYESLPPPAKESWPNPLHAWLDKINKRTLRTEDECNEIQNAMAEAFPLPRTARLFTEDEASVSVLSQKID